MEVDGVFTRDDIIDGGTAALGGLLFLGLVRHCGVRTGRRWRSRGVAGCELSMSRNGRKSLRLKVRLDFAGVHNCIGLGTMHKHEVCIITPNTIHHLHPSAFASPRYMYASFCFYTHLLLPTTTTIATTLHSSYCTCCDETRSNPNPAHVPSTLTTISTQEAPYC